MSDHLVKRLEAIAFYEHTSRDALIHNCGLGKISMGDIQDILTHIKELEANLAKAVGVPRKCL